MAPTPAQGKVHVLVVEDEAAIAAFIRLGLEFSGAHVEVCHDGLEAIRVCEERRPDVVLLDTCLPGLDGWEVCKRMRALNGVPIIMATAFDSADDKVRGFLAGADDYIAKPFDFTELLARVNAVLRRCDSQIIGDELVFEGIRLRRDTRHVRHKGAQLKLTDTEFHLLELFMLRPCQPVPRKEVQDWLWGEGRMVDVAAVDTYVGRLQSKLGGPEAIRAMPDGSFALQAD